MSPVVERNLRVHAAKDARSYGAANRAGIKVRKYRRRLSSSSQVEKHGLFAMAGQSGAFPLTGNGVRTLCEDVALPRADGQRSSEV